MSPHTCRNYESDLRQFFSNLTASAKSTPTSNYQIDSSTVREWLITLHRTGRSKATIRRKLAALSNFFDFLMREGLMNSNPANLIARPHAQKKLPAHLSIEDSIRLIESPNEQTDLGKRDRVILELLYASGLRVSELVNLDLRDINFENRLLRVIQERHQERIVPFAQPTSEALSHYLSIRTRFLRTPHRHRQHRHKISSQPLILNCAGERITPRSVARVIHKYASPSAHPTSPCVLRHSFAAHMLDAGADVRHIQQLLGHAHITTTQQYSAISIDKLAATYQHSMPTLPIDHAEQFQSINC